jgi:hypothetical protein
MEAEKQLYPFLFQLMLQDGPVQCILKQELQFRNWQTEGCLAPH